MLQMCRKCQNRLTSKEVKLYICLCKNCVEESGFTYIHEPDREFELVDIIGKKDRES